LRRRPFPASKTCCLRAGVSWRPAQGRCGRRGTSRRRLRAPARLCRRRGSGPRTPGSPRSQLQTARQGGYFPPPPATARQTPRPALQVPAAFKSRWCHSRRSTGLPSSPTQAAAWPRRAGVPRTVGRQGLVFLSAERDADCRPMGPATPALVLESATSPKNRTLYYGYTTCPARQWQALAWQDPEGQAFCDDKA